MLTGLRADFDAAGAGLAVVLPADAAVDAEEAGWGRMVALISDCHVLVVINREATVRHQTVETIALTAYCHAMS